MVAYEFEISRRACAIELFGAISCQIMMTEGKDHPAFNAFGKMMQTIFFYDADYFDKLGFPENGRIMPHLAPGLVHSSGLEMTATCTIAPTSPYGNVVQKNGDKYSVSLNALRTWYTHDGAAKQARRKISNSLKNNWISITDCLIYHRPSILLVQKADFSDPMWVTECQHKQGAIQFHYTLNRRGGFAHFNLEPQTSDTVLAYLDVQPAPPQ